MYKITLTFITMVLLCLDAFSITGIENADIVVGKDGSGNFSTIQEALYSIPPMRKKRTTIFIKNGVYTEKLIISKGYGAISLIGESAENTVITYNDFAQRKNSFGEEMGTTASSSVFIFADDFIAENITFENSAGEVGQAVAVRVSSDRAAFKNCRFLGNQDTLYPNEPGARQYYYKCYIEGTVDFIFGWSTAVFDNCHIHSLRKDSGYITAASTDKKNAFGFVFLNCKITGNGDNCIYLGRPWRDYAKTVFINCNMDKSIIAKGWHNWSKPAAEKTAFYAEYKSNGPGANPKERVEWSHQLTDTEASNFTLENIFGGWIPNR
ncbi:pectinesterase family protein [Labilibaculum sp. K2S]|uniref:pectinesterase family protein n=1 Tax=Labilibaculum sp. K2S TaxID=3056386 RepID=UPI0025A4CAB3|nr:pectinesterase family protein [Labilibaculum sp. K2S]MDM8161470.1 pectinesterase family protein [Labilibaculum sp. K2S]